MVASTFFLQTFPVARAGGAFVAQAVVGKVALVPDILRGAASLPTVLLSSRKSSSILVGKTVADGGRRIALACMERTTGCGGRQYGLVT